MLFTEVVTTSTKNMIFKELIKWEIDMSLEREKSDLQFLETGMQTTLPIFFWKNKFYKLFLKTNLKKLQWIQTWSNLNRLTISIRWQKYWTNLDDSYITTIGGTY
jgi:hypothetical protein